MRIGELKWPPGWPRTGQKDSGSIFDRRDGTGEWRPILPDRAERLLRHELDMLGAERVTITAGCDAAAVYFTRNGTQFVMAVDRFDSNAANLRSIGLAIAAMRTLDRHGGSALMDRAFAGFAALPAPRSCWDVLGIEEGADDEEIEQAFRTKAKECHPDRGGSNELMAELTNARATAMKMIMKQKRIRNK
jgi:hypothetical protein